MKRLISVFLCLILVFTLLPLAAAPARALNAGGFDYEYLNPGDVKITGYTGDASSVTVPPVLAGCQVVAIGDSAFSGETAITSITFPESLTSIGRYAFMGCTGLQTITIPGSVAVVSTGAFQSCTGLTSVNLNAGTTDIGTYAFYGCSNLNYLYLSSTLKSIGNYAFCYCSELSYVGYPGSMTQWKKVTVGIDNDPLKLSTTYYGESPIMSSGVCGANGDNVVWTLDWDNQLRISGTGAMKDYSASDPSPWYYGGIGSVIIEPGVTYIGNETFESSMLFDIFIPHTVTSLGTKVFYDCTALNQIYYSGRESVWNEMANAVVINPEPYQDHIDGLAYAAVLCSVPQLQGASIVNGVVQVKWYPVPGASQYVVLRKMNGGEWTELTTVTSASYLDTDVSNANEYTYAVKARVDGKLSDYYWRGVSIVYIAPQLKSATAVSNGIQVNWETVGGSATYVVFRKTGTGNWTQIGTTASTSYLDKNVTSGTTYTYTVRANIGGILSGYNSAGVSAVYTGGSSAPAAPQLLAPAIVNGVVQVKWKSVPGATKYLVFRKTGSGNWVQLGSATGTSYLDKTVANGNRYTYTVRAYAGGTLSSYDTAGVSIDYIAPELQGTSIVNGIVQVKWKAVSGATKYVIFRKTGSGNWVQLGSATGTSYQDKTVTNGNTYTYTVRAVVGGTLSGYDPTGVSIKYIAPELQGTSIVNGFVQVKWKAVSGATKYVIFRKTGSGSWAQLGSATGTSYLDKTVTNGNTYTYTVRAMVGGALSGYDTVGVSTKYIAPVLQNVTYTGTGVKVTWQSVAGATKYVVFRKTGSGNWVQIGSCTAASYLDTTAVPNNTYTYTVRAMVGGTLSGYDTIGKTITVV